MGFKVAGRAVFVSLLVIALAWSVGPEVKAEGVLEPMTATGVVLINGKPVAGVRVCGLGWYTDDGNPPNGATCALTGIDGGYTVKVPVLENSLGDRDACLAASPVTTAHRDLFAPISLTSHGGAWCRLPLDPNPGAVVAYPNIDIEPFHRLKGRVVDPQGRPVVGAVVDSGTPTKHRTDRRGHFSVRLGIYYYDDGDITVTAPGFRRSWSRGQWRDGYDLGHIVMVPKNKPAKYSYSGRIVDAAGKPFVGARVCVVGGACLSKAGSQGRYYGLVPNTSVRLRISAPGTTEVITADSSPQLSWGSFGEGNDYRFHAKRSIVGSLPKIVRKATRPEVLMVRLGAWAPKPVSQTCRWRVGSKVVKKSCSALRIKAAYRGKPITVTVKGSRPGYPSQSRTSRVFRLSHG
ncbi:MAG TPA: carboxypeptidase-like regulatory domain-containing protein [Propionicimonas sp.]|nr:carboxypeptidase-like regulatory domain-containing protein [Propionicimonas sp.]